MVKSDLTFVIPTGFNVSSAISNIEYSLLTDVMEQMGMNLGACKSSLLAYLKHIKYIDDYSTQLLDSTQVYVHFNPFP